MKLLLTYPCVAQFKTVVELKDFRPRTKREYVRYLCKLAEHFQSDPATLSQDQVREYFLFLRQHKHYSGSAMTIARASLRCFFQDCLQHADWTVFGELAIRRVEPLPIVLSRQEVAAVLGALREPRFRACLRLIYHCGLRVGGLRRGHVSYVISLTARSAALRIFWSSDNRRSKFFTTVPTLR